MLSGINICQLTQWTVEWIRSESEWLYFQFEEVDSVCAAHGFVGCLSANFSGRDVIPPCYRIRDIIVRIIDGENDSFVTDFFNDMFQ